MRKFLSLLVALATVTMAWAAQGGTLTSSKTPIDPTQTVTLTYDGTGTNFANWEPKCFIHSWLVAADGQTFSKSYSTDWASCNGDGDYASLASKLKMTYSGTKGKYTISMNIKEFFNVADADLPKIGKLGVIVRAQYEGDNNKTNDMFVNVAYTAPASKVTYTALTKAPTTGNWAGQYLIVFADNKAHATVSGSDLAATSDALTIDEGEIEINSTDKYYVTVELMQGGYSIKLPTGKYLSVNASSNKVAEVNAAYAFNFEYTASGIKIFGKDTKGDLRYVMNNGTYYRGYKWSDSYKLPTLYRTGDEAPALQTLYFVNTLDWAKVNAFVWPATGDAYKAWPGEAAVKTGEKALEKDIYSYTFPATFVNAIFNDGSKQTADLKWDKAKPYFVPGAKNAAGKYEGTWYASKDDIPVPGKYYITGDSALVVDAGLAADKAWVPAAIKAAADTTVLNLKAGVEYKLKVTVDGTWATALGYNALSEKTEGLIADGDDNICFKLAEAGAVQVVYFKKGAVVTFKVLGNFYIKPVIVETLNLVPNMWSEAGAKMAAWVWGDDLAGAWTPFFAGEGDTLSVKINAEADSIIFVRMNSDATEPDWAKEWNRVKDEEIDHVGLTYTITAWGAEGVSVGQWTPYEPVVPGKYYITGDSALVVDAGLTADKAWAPAAIKADADTTVLNLKAGVEYKLKVTVDGTWATALGYNALSEKAEGLIADGDDNICFKLTEAGAVQVIYFKEGDVVTFKVLGNFYIKPVIVETLKLVPNMWSEAGAKMAAWVWGDDLAGAWTPFFAGEGDTLSVKIDEQADSVIFVRFANEVAAPAWEATIWNRVKDEEIDHVGLTYTITAWGDEGVSVGQWTPYEPVVPGKYYITGDSALVVDAGLTADKAWAPAAIKADADTTVLNLKAGVEYKLKVTVDGTWNTALGFDALSEKAEGLIADADGNICFKLAEAGAVQVIYFKEGDVVTFKVLGKFYIKPVIVETLKLVPNMWSEANAKMAAWVWGEGLAGAWTPFFAGEGDTLSVKIDEQADSVIFVRFANEVAAPAWEATIWNRVKDEEIDHVGLTYTITAWGDEGVSVGQWTPYEPVVPGKYYITGDSALVVDAGLTADKAWAPAAIKADADTTVLNLKTGVEYKLKVTVDGTWNTALGFDALSEKAEGLIADADGNICFKLAEAGAVQVIYFKEGDVVTFKVLGKFYIKPVIVETLKLVPNMWSEANAKMAAWVWGEGLAGAWTPFFAGEGDTLSVKIDEQADSVIFVRFASEVAAPAWEATIWNRVKDEEIDHVGLTYTITAWGDEGVSVGQWTPYEPVVPGKYYITGDSALVVDAGLTADKAWAPAAIKADADTTVLNLKGNVDYKLKITLDGQWATALGYDNLSVKAEGLSADADDNICFKLTEPGVKVVYFKEGEKVTYELIGKFSHEVASKYYMKNNWNAGTEWTWLEMIPDNEGMFKLENVVYGGTGVNYNTKAEDNTDSKWVPEADILGDQIGAKDTVTFTLNPLAGKVTAKLIGKYVPSGDTKYYMKNNWNAGEDWTWMEMTKDGANYKLENVVYGGTGVNYNTEASDAGSKWVEEANFLGDAIEAKDTVTFTLDPVAATVTAKLIGKYIPSGCEGKFGLKVGENIIEFAKNAEQTQWTEYYKQGVELTQGDIIALYNICEEQTFKATVAGYEGLTPLVGGDGWTVTETGKYDFYLKLIFGADELYVIKQGTPTDPKVEVWGEMNDWKDGIPMTLSEDKTKATISANIDPDTYEFKIMVNGEWRSNAQTFTRQNNSAVGITMNEDANMKFVADLKGDYTVTWTFATNELVITYPTSTSIENLVAPANELRKVMIDGKLYILRDGKIYSVQGQLIR